MVIYLDNYYTQQDNWNFILCRLVLNYTIHMFTKSSCVKGAQFETGEIEHSQNHYAKSGTANNTNW